MAIITLDTHIDIPLDYATADVDPLTADLQVNLTKMAAGGLDAGFFIVFVGQTARTDDGYAKAQADALTKFEAIHRMAEQLYPDRIEIAYRAADVPRIAASGKLVAAIGVENGFSLGRDLELLERYYTLGARYVGLVHDGDNDLARSARPRPQLGDAAEPDTGVSALGAEAIARMNRLGHHGRRLARLEANGTRCDAPVRCAGHRVALLRRQRQRPSAQHGRRDVARPARPTAASCKSWRSTRT